MKEAVDLPHIRRRSRCPGEIERRERRASERMEPGVDKIGGRSPRRRRQICRRPRGVLFAELLAHVRFGPASVWPGFGHRCAVQDRTSSAPGLHLLA